MVERESGRRSKNRQVTKRVAQKQPILVLRGHRRSPPLQASPFQQQSHRVSVVKPLHRHRKSALERERNRASFLVSAHAPSRTHPNNPDVCTMRRMEANGVLVPLQSKPCIEGAVRLKQP